MRELIICRPLLPEGDKLCARLKQVSTRGLKIKEKKMLEYVGLKTSLSGIQILTPFIY